MERINPISRIGPISSQPSTKIEQQRTIYQTEDMTRIVLSDLKFSRILSYLGDISAYWWAVDTQSGPFDFSWIFQNSENEMRNDEAFVDYGEIESPNRNLLKPGTFPELAEYFVIDEWSYVGAFHAEDAETAKEHFKRFFLRYDRDFIEGFKEGSDFLLVYPDSYWELYTDSPEIELRIKEAQQITAPDA